MKVGVLMPCRTPLPYARAAVESILAQTYRDFTFLIVDDASDEPVCAYLAGLPDPRVRIIRHDTPRGVSACLNRGLRELEHDVIFRMDADDVSKPNRLEKQLARLLQEPELAVLGTNIERLPESTGGEVPSTLPVGHVEIAYRLCWSNAINHPTAAYRREAVLACGGYDTSLVCGQDYALWTTLVTRYRVANLPDQLLFYRTHAAQNSSRHPQEKERIRITTCARYRRDLTGLAPAALFDYPARWIAENHPSAAEWEVWLDFLAALSERFRAGKVGQMTTPPFNPNRDLARRLYRTMTAGHRLGAEMPPRARRLLKQLAPFYAALKGIL